MPKPKKVLPKKKPKKKKVPKPKKKASPGNLITGPLSPLSFVITGVLECGDRKDLQDLIKTLGGFARSGVSGKTNYLITGHILEDGR